MTVPSSTFKSGPYLGNGATTVFPYEFRILSADDLRVIHTDANGIETAWVQGTDYAVSGVGDGSGGSITATVAPAAGETITILRSIDFLQETDLQNQGAYYAEVVEEAFDRAAMRDQQQQEELGRALKIPASDDFTPRPLPSAAERANKAIVFDADGNVIVSTDDYEDQAESTAANAAAAQAAEAAALSHRDQASAHRLNASNAQTAAEAAQAAAESAAGANLSNADSRAAAITTNIPAPVNYIRTAGYTSAGDGGAALYKRAASEPAHAGKFQSADGAWWELAVDEVSCTMFGALPGLGVKDTEMASAIAVAAAIGAALVIPGGSSAYSLTKQVDFSPLLNGKPKLILGGKVEFDFGGATDVGQFPDYGLIYIDGGDLEFVGGLANSVSKGGSEVQIISPQVTVNAGDILCIYNPADGSWNAARPYYRAGEWIYVAETDGGAAPILTLHGGLYDNYAGGSVSIYRHPAKSLEVIGGTLTTREPTLPAFDGIPSLRTDRIARSDFSMFRSTDPSYATQVHNQPIGITGHGYNANQRRPTALGDCYGIVIANGQDCEFHGNFKAVKHAFTCGGFDEPGCVPNRNIRAYGTFRNSGSAGFGQFAANTHGNSEFCYFYGTIDGGISLGGDNCGAPGATIIGRSELDGVAIYLVDMLGFNFDFTGSHIKAYGAPQTNARATIDIGADGGGPNANTLRGGIVRLDGATIDASLSSRPLTYQNRGYVGAERAVVSLKGVRMKAGLAGAPIIVAAVVSGRNLDQLDLHGFDNEKGCTYSVFGVDKVKGWRDEGEVTITPTTAAAVASNTATINAPRKPQVRALLKTSTIGGKTVIPYSDDAATTATSLTVGVITADATAFLVTTPASLGWEATLDE